MQCSMMVSSHQWSASSVTNNSHSSITLNSVSFSSVFSCCDSNAPLRSAVSSPQVPPPPQREWRWTEEG